MTKIESIEFARTGNASLLMDLYLPDRQKDAGTLPVIVWVHGGGWREGTRLTPPVLAIEHGYALASIDYRLTPHATWPAQLDDCKNAIHFLREHSDRYHIDPERIGAWGKSAGGHLVAMLAVLSEIKGNENAPWRIQAACDYNGPSDLELFAHTKWKTRFAVMYDVTCALLGGPIEENRDLARQASPIQFVSPCCAPLRIAHGDLDDVVPIHQSEILHHALAKVGAKVEYEIVNGRGHHIASVETDSRSIEFFDRFLGPFGSPNDR